MFLREARIVNRPETIIYPFHLPALSGVDAIQFDSFITFFVGENGSGKSTLLEALAIACGFNPEGGSIGNSFYTVSTESTLHEHLKLSWMPKATSGFYFRAESFFNFATYNDEAQKGPGGSYAPYGGRSLHEQSHGESFLNLFLYRFGKRQSAIYLLDEPEAALSPTRQLSFLRILHDHERSKKSQFIIASHSPILLAYPGARILNFDKSPLEPVEYRDTEHYAITKQFINHPEGMLRELFKDDLEDEH